MRYKYYLAMALALWLVTSGKTALAEALNLELRPFSKGNYQLAKGRYPQAAAHWHQLSVLLLSNPQKVSQQQMWQSAGLAASLAAIAADKSEDPIAYQYWADSTRYLLTGGTNWSQVQQNLHQRLETANTQLSVAMQVTDVTSGIDENLDVELTALQLWDEKLNLFAFTTPRLGLNRYDAEIDNSVSLSVPSIAPNAQRQGTGKKLSGYDSNFSHSPSFTPTPSPTSIDATNAQAEQQPEALIINTSDAGTAASAQALSETIMPTPDIAEEQTTIAINPLGISSINQTQATKVESLQKRQIEPTQLTEKTIENTVSETATQEAKSQ
ncbi:hypothetical protein TUM4261_28560 [Shewanella sp. c952]|uniref:hypothetical protein n=1 Tax=Shewanella sp. c952 TaxID=2815913 RepID=UPI001BC608C9|nr:hypothetical protein [Shewanella sp. c952]GIU13822.1 hypothetical protein TUM4261_28560 [Shewanella sp. c952]